MLEWSLMSKKLYDESVQIHRQHVGKLATIAICEVKDKHDLSLLYTPGVAEPCRVIEKDKEESFKLTSRGRTVAVISDGSAVLGLGNIGPEASLPVMEGKALLMKEFAGVDAVPIAISTQDPHEIAQFIRHIAPSFVGINIEDISAPRCFDIETELQDLGITVFHDDQHGTAIVVSAALHNAAKVIDKKFEDLKVVVVGAGAAGMAVSLMLLGIEMDSNGCRKVDGVQKVGDLILIDSKGAINEFRTDLDKHKQCIAAHSNKNQVGGSLAEAIKGADVVIGVSRANLITQDMVKSMTKDAIVFAMANPEPEIMPDLAMAAGAAIVATGRSDFKNQINNVLAFPGVFRAVVDGRLPRITTQMKHAAAQAIADLVKEPNAEKIIPEPFEPNVAKVVSQAILRVK